MSGATFNTRFLFTAVGLQEVLGQFESAAAKIKTEAATMGKMNFAGMESALPVLKNIDNTLLLMGQHANLLSSSASKAGSAFNPMAAGAAKAATATKTVSASMTQLASASGAASSAAGRTASALGEMGAVGKSAFSGIMSGARAAASSISMVSAAANTAGRTMARMGAMAAVPFAGLKGLSGMAAGPLLASTASTLLHPGTIASFGTGYGIYTHGNVEKAAAESAAKSWKPGMTEAQKADIKKNVASISRQLAGQTIYSPTDYAKAAAEYAGMGGNVGSQYYTAEIAKLMGQYSQAINSPTIGEAVAPLLSSNLIWYGGDAQKAGSYDAIKKSADLRSMMVAQTKLQYGDLNDLLKDWEPVAKQYGQDQYSAAATVAGLAQLGLKPQQAGMAARRIALRGTPKASDQEKMEAGANINGEFVDEITGDTIKLSEVSKALVKAGMDWSDINIETQGGMNEMLSNVSEHFKAAGYTSEDIQSFNKTVWGIQGTTGAAMMSQNPNFFKEMEALFRRASEGEGATVGMSNTQTDNMIDQFKMLGSAFKGSADALGEYFEPGVVRLTAFIKDKVVPQMNALGGAIAAGDWSGAADIVGSALGTIKDEFLGSGQGISDWVNSAIDGVDEFVGRMADWASGGGAGNLLGEIGDWVAGIWDNIDWGQIEGIASNLGTALTEAWGQAMTWLEGALDNVNWDSVGTRVGAAIETGFGFLYTLADKIPWASLTTAATNALTGIILGIDWPKFYADLQNAGNQVGAAVYNGLAASNVGTLFQTWATEFQNAMGMAIANVAAMLAGLSANIGVSVSGISSAVDKGVSVGGNILDKGKKVIQTLADPDGVHNAIYGAEGNPSGMGLLTDYVLNSSVGKYAQEKWSPMGLLPSFASEVGWSPMGLLPSLLNKVYESSAGILESLGITGSSRGSGAGSGEIPNASDAELMDGAVFTYHSTTVAEDQAAEMASMKTQVPAEDFTQLSDYLSYLVRTELPAYQEGTQQCLDDTLMMQSGYAKSAAETATKVDDAWAKAIDLVNAKENYHYLSAVSTGKAGDPESTYLFDAREDKFLGSIANLEKDGANLRGDVLTLVDEFTRVLNSGKVSATDINYSKGLKFIGGDIAQGEAFDYGAQPGISGGGGSSYYQQMMKESESFFGDLSSKIYRLSGSKVLSGGNAPEAPATPQGFEAPATPKGFDAPKSPSAPSSDFDSNNRDNNKNTEATAQNTKNLVDTAEEVGSVLTKLAGSDRVTFTLTNPEEQKPYEKTFTKDELEKGGYLSRWGKSGIGYELKNAQSQPFEVADAIAQSAGKQVEAEKESVASTGKQTSETSDNTSAISALTGEFAGFQSLVASQDYAGIAQLMKDLFTYDNPATKEDERDRAYSAEDWEAVDSGTESRDKLVAELLAYGKVLKATQSPYPDIPKAIEKSSASSERSLNALKDGIFETASTLNNISDGFKQFLSSKYATNDAVSGMSNQIVTQQQAAAASADQKAAADAAMTKNMYSEICGISGFFTPEKVTPTGTMVSPTGASLVRLGDDWVTKEQYQQQTGQSLAQEQLAAAARVGKVPFAGSIGPEDLAAIEAFDASLTEAASQRFRSAMATYQANLSDKELNLPAGWDEMSTGNWGATVGGNPLNYQKPPTALLGGLAENGGVEIPITANTDAVDSALNDVKSTAAQGAAFDVKVTSNAAAISGQLAGLNGSASFWVYVNTVYTASGASSGYRDALNSTNYGDMPSGWSYPIKKVGSVKDIPYPAYAEGGYTGAYGGEATVHPHEVILNAAQQRNVASSMGSGSSARTVNVRVDARGAIFADSRGMDVLVSKIKDSLQDESYR